MWKCEKCLVISIIWCVISLTYGKPHSSIREATNSSSETDPIFRPPVATITGNPKCARNFTYCENIESYPYDHLKNILDRNNSYRYVFHKEELKEELVNRHSSDGSFICRSTSKTIFPKVGKNKNNKWKFIVNQDDYVQGIVVETCYHFDSPCDIVGEIPAMYTTFCRQKYLYSKLLSLNDRGYPTPDIFKIPSACCCAYRRNTAFLRQFGALVSAVSPKIVPEIL